MAFRWAEDVERSTAAQQADMALVMERRGSWTGDKAREASGGEWAFLPAFLFCRMALFPTTSLHVS